MPTRGGSRHRSKPYIESGLLTKVLLRHEDILVNFKGYESCSRNSGADPKGLVHCLDLVNDVLELEASAEIHPAPLRQSMLHLLTQKPSLNNTCQSGSLWVHMRSERLNALLFHIRRLARSGPTQACVNALSGQELGRLQNTLKKVVIQEAHVPLQNGEENQKQKEEDEKQKEEDEQEEEEEEEEKRPKVKKLKVNPSDVSCDSQGFPNMLKSPQQKQEVMPSRLLKKRVGQAKKIQEIETDKDLRGRMGFEKQKPYKKPAAKAKSSCQRPPALKKPAGSKKTLGKEDSTGTFAKGCSKKQEQKALQGDGPWLVLQKTVAKKPERAYHFVLGTKVEGLKPRLIVEVTKTRSQKYSWVSDRIIDSLGKGNLSKPEAIALREKMCKQYP